jgi:hypothetical protein
VLLFYYCKFTARGGIGFHESGAHTEGYIQLGEFECRPRPKDNSIPLQWWISQFPITESGRCLLMKSDINMSAARVKSKVTAVNLVTARLWLWSRTQRPLLFHTRLTSRHIKDVKIRRHSQLHEKVQREEARVLFSARDLRSLFCISTRASIHPRGLELRSDVLSLRSTAGEGSLTSSFASSVLIILLSPALSNGEKRRRYHQG